MVKINRVPLVERHPIYFIVGSETYFTSSNLTIFEYQYLVLYGTNMGIQVHRNDIGYFIVLGLILFLPIPF